MKNLMRTLAAIGLLLIGSRGAEALDPWAITTVEYVVYGRGDVDDLWWDQHGPEGVVPLIGVGTKEAKVRLPMSGGVLTVFGNLTNIDPYPGRRKFLTVFVRFANGTLMHRTFREGVSYNYEKDRVNSEGQWEVLGSYTGDNAPQQTGRIKDGFKSTGDISGLYYLPDQNRMVGEWGRNGSAFAYEEPTGPLVQGEQRHSYSVIFLNNVKPLEPNKAWEYQINLSITTGTGFTKNFYPGTKMTSPIWDGDGVLSIDRAVYGDTETIGNYLRAVEANEDWNNWKWGNTGPAEGASGREGLTGVPAKVQPAVKVADLTQMAQAWLQGGCVKLPVNQKGQLTIMWPNQDSVTRPIVQEDPAPNRGKSLFIQATLRSGFLVVKEFKENSSVINPWWDPAATKWALPPRTGLWGGNWVY